MCGIAGFIDFNSTSNEFILKKMIDTLTHRGPDGQGIDFIQNENCQIGLAHQRLSIIDLHTSAGQPMKWKQWALVFNGEIYNYREIKKELAELGHQFITESDTEMILHAIDQWGLKAVDKFIGMFVIVLYDKENKTIQIIRDRAGVKPLYYYWHEGLFLFASELKAFHEHPQFKKEINLDAVALFMRYSYIPAPHCIFQNTFKLLQGYYLFLTTNTCQLTTTKYWDVNDAYLQPKLNISESEAISETEAILKKAFDYRMVADVPVGVFLSGGYDSSAVAALLQKDSSNKIKTFTIGFHEPKYNEAPFAKQVAEHLGTEHTEYYCTINEAKAILPTLPHFYDEPFGDSSAIPTMLVSQLARKSVTVALSADGGDELFGGYFRHPIIQKMDKTIGRLPQFARNSIYKVSGLVSPERIPIIKNKPLIGQRYAKFRKLIKKSSASAYLQNMSSVLDDETLENLFQNPTEKLPSFFDEKDLPNCSVLDNILAKDYKTYMADDILTKVDRATMSVALEGREPFLDQHIIDWVARLPDDMKIRNGEKKWILKQIVHKYLPKEMMDRPKWGFAIPIDSWFESELSDYFYQYLNKEYISHQNIFNFEEINSWLVKYKLGQKEYIVQLWCVLMFQLWYEKWMK